MRLESGRHLVVVSPEGGSILQWQVDEHFVLGPTRETRIGKDLKWRGVTHWCLPNFGTPPDAYAHLGQHGWLRNTVIPNLTAEGNGVRMTILPHLAPGGLGAGVIVELDPDGITHTLGIVNGGPERQPILPALHPYFAVGPSGAYLVRMGGEVVAFSRTDLAINATPRILPRTGPVEVALGVGSITLDLPDECTHLVLWSDDPTSYVCVEPVFGTPRTFGSPEGRWLESGEGTNCRVRFNFTPA